MKRRQVAFMVVLAFAVTLLGTNVSQAQAQTQGATITVNSTADTWIHPDGKLTLREAIELAIGDLAVGALDAVECAHVSNSSYGPPCSTTDPIGAGAADTIEFDTFGTIQMQGGTGFKFLSTGFDTVDGSMATITIDGSGIFEGLVIGSEQNTIRGLTIRNCTTAIDIRGGSSNRVVGNHIESNSVDGVHIEGSVGTTIGGTASGDGNVITGNGVNGVHIIGGSGYVIQGNTISQNAKDGLHMVNTGYQVQIGGLTPEAANFIQSNGEDGLEIGGARYIVQGNFIGDASGTSTAQGNGGAGVHIRASDAVIGGTAQGSPNNISGNQIGVKITTNDWNQVVGNYIKFNTSAGVVIEDSSGENRLRENFIGYNRSDGVRIDVSSDNRLEDNIITGNTLAGVLVSGDSNVIADNNISFNEGSSGVEIRGRRTELTGNQIYANSESGVLINHATVNTIGGAEAGVAAGEPPGNDIRYNLSNGIEIRGSGSSHNTVQGNRIEHNGGPSPPWITPTGGNGILIIDAWQNGIGATTAAMSGACTGGCNLISGNQEHGIKIAGDAYLTIVGGNFIGTDLTGTQALGNAEAGVRIVNAADSLIGGPASPGAQWCQWPCNVISGNGSDGVSVTGSGATGVEVQGNFIGVSVDWSGTSCTNQPGNGRDGVNVDAASGMVVGSPSALATELETRNTIACNVRNGVTVASNVKINGNIFFGNGGLAIDLGGDGVTPNDAGDGDTGPNELQNFPVLTSAAPAGAEVNVEGTLNSAANTGFLLEFFSSEVCDPSGFGEGSKWLGAEIITTDGSGDAAFAITLPEFLPPGHFITATATDPNGNTSEFSGCWSMPRGGTTELLVDGPDAAASAAESSGSSSPPYAAIAGAAAAAAVALAASGWYARRRLS